MDRLALQEVTLENWHAALELAVFPEQLRFVAHSAPIAAIALAKAYIRPRGLIWVPYVFSAGEEMVGFVELAYEAESVDNYWIYHFFIDQRYQGRGYGKEALLLFLRFIQDQNQRCQEVQLSVHPENERALRLYLGVGFQPTEATLHDERVYRLAFK